MRSTSGFVRQSCVRSLRRLPFTMLKYSGCASKYFFGGSNRSNVWQLPRPPPKRPAGPPCFAPTRIAGPFARLRAAKSPLNMSHQNGSRCGNAGVCASSRSSGTEKASRAGTTVCHEAYQRQPPNRSSSSYTP